MLLLLAAEHAENVNDLVWIATHWKYLVVMIAVFAIYGWLLNRLLFAPIARILETREAATRSAEKTVEEVRAEESRQVAAFEAALADARRAAAQEREQLKREAQGAADALKEKARGEAKSQLELARQALAAEVAMAEKGLRADAEKLAAEMLSRVLRRKVA